MAFGGVVPEGEGGGETVGCRLVGECSGLLGAADGTAEAVGGRRGVYLPGK